MNQNQRDDTITLFGVGISYMEALALPRTLSRIIRNTCAVMYEPPLCEEDKLCYIYYIDRDSRDDGYVVLKNNFAITSPIIYKTDISMSDLMGDKW